MARKRRNKINWVYVILIFCIVICLGIIFILLVRNSQILTPDFAPGTIDTNAIKEKDEDKKMELNSGGGAASIAYSNVVIIDKEKQDIKLYFKNPNKSRESMVLEIIIKQNEKEYAIARSNLLPPGYALYNMELANNKIIVNGGYEGIFRITYYNVETGEKQIVNTEIEISIEVK